MCCHDNHEQHISHYVILMIHLPILVLINILVYVICMKNHMIPIRLVF